MSFNKKYIGLNTIKGYISDGGVKSLDSLFSVKTDTFIFTDKISSEIYYMYLKNEFKKIECLIRFK